MAPKAAETSSAAAAESSTGEAAALPAPKRGRTRNAERPRIDIDDEIERANELSTIMKKLSHAAKMEQRNATRCKARLLKKCSKVSAQDLERLAVLKRCGLINADADDATTKEKSPSASTGQSSATSQATDKKAGGPAMKRIAEVMKKGKGQDALRSMELVSCFMRSLPTSLEDEEAAVPQGGHAKKRALARCSAAAAPAPLPLQTEEPDREWGLDSIPTEES